MKVKREQNEVNKMLGDFKAKILDSPRSRTRLACEVTHQEKMLKKANETVLQEGSRK